MPLSLSLSLLCLSFYLDTRLSVLVPGSPLKTRRGRDQNWGICQESVFHSQRDWQLTFSSRLWNLGKDGDFSTLPYYPVFLKKPAPAGSRWRGQIAGPQEGGDARWTPPPSSRLVVGEQGQFSPIRPQRRRLCFSLKDEDGRGQGQDGQVGLDGEGCREFERPCRGKGEDQDLRTPGQVLAHPHRSLPPRRVLGRVPAVSRHHGWNSRGSALINASERRWGGWVGRRGRPPRPAGDGLGGRAG